MTNLGTKMFGTAKDYAIRWLRRLLASREYELTPRWRLDDVVGSLGFDVHETPTLLEIDTQAFDLEVLEGAGRVLPMIRAVQIEGFVRPIYEGSPSYLETIRYLTDRDFQLSGLFPVTVDASLRLQTIDCIFINSRFNLGT